MSNVVSLIIWMWGLVVCSARAIQPVTPIFALDPHSDRLTKHRAPRTIRFPPRERYPPHAAPSQAARDARCYELARTSDARNAMAAA